VVFDKLVLFPYSFLDEEDENNTEEKYNNITKTYKYNEVEFENAEKWGNYFAAYMKKLKKKIKKEKGKERAKEFKK